MKQSRPEDGLSKLVGVCNINSERVPVKIVSGNDKGCGIRELGEIADI